MSVPSDYNLPVIQADFDILSKQLLDRMIVTVQLYHYGSALPHLHTLGVKMIQRDIVSTLLQTANSFKVVTITGPRQSGKTTLAKMTFVDHKYYDLDNPLLVQRFNDDPEGFLSPRRQEFIIDEFQYIPQVCNYIKVFCDENQITGQYILTGSNQFEYMHNITQSLAGRTALLKLLPMTWKEMYGENKPDIFTAIQRGWYPALLNQEINLSMFYGSYIGTYLERDIRNLSMVKNLIQFRQFLSLCAGRTGCELNKSKLSEDAGIDIKTLNHWLSLLETSYIITFIQPYHRNWTKRLTKTPKMYFLDTGLACHLLGIQDGDTLRNHPLRGEIFETYVIGEITKYFTNQGLNVSLTYLRETSGIEIDLIIEFNTKLIPIEIKSGMTFNLSWMDNLKKLSSRNSDFLPGLIFYGNDDEYTQNGIHICSSKNVAANLNSILNK